MITANDLKPYEFVQLSYDKNGKVNYAPLLKELRDRETQGRSVRYNYADKHSFAFRDVILMGRRDVNGENDRQLRVELLAEFSDLGGDFYVRYIEKNFGNNLYAFFGKGIFQDYLSAPPPLLIEFSLIEPDSDGIVLPQDIMQPFYQGKGNQSAAWYNGQSSLNIGFGHDNLPVNLYYTGNVTRLKPINGSPDEWLNALKKCCIILDNREGDFGLLCSALQVGENATFDGTNYKSIAEEMHNQWLEFTIEINNKEKGKLWFRFRHNTPETHFMQKIPKDRVSFEVQGCFVPQIRQGIFEYIKNFKNLFTMPEAWRIDIDGRGIGLNNALIPLHYSVVSQINSKFKIYNYNARKWEDIRKLKNNTLIYQLPNGSNISISTLENKNNAQYFPAYGKKFNIFQTEGQPMGYLPLIEGRLNDVIGGVGIDGLRISWLNSVASVLIQQIQKGLGSYYLDQFNVDLKIEQELLIISLEEKQLRSSRKYQFSVKLPSKSEPQSMSFPIGPFWGRLVYGV
jgi:hypothetical protein